MLAILRPIIVYYWTDLDVIRMIIYQNVNDCVFTVCKIPSRNGVISKRRRKSLTHRFQAHSYVGFDVKVTFLQNISDGSS